MNYYKIVNLVQANSSCDYKGLSIDLFTSGMQVYPHDLTADNYCLIETSEISEGHVDVTLLSESEYEQMKSAIISLKPPSLTDQLVDLQSKNAQMVLDNFELKSRVIQAEQVTQGNSLAAQELLELLIDLVVI